MPYDPLLKAAMQNGGVRFLLNDRVEVELTLLGSYWDRRPYKQGMRLQLVRDGQLDPNVQFSFPAPWTSKGRENFLARARAAIPSFAVPPF